MTDQAVTPVPGWYVDAAGETRWWDGAAWTHHVLPSDATPVTPTPRSPEVPPSATPATTTHRTPARSETSAVTPIGLGTSTVTPPGRATGRWTSQVPPRAQALGLILVSFIVLGMAAGRFLAHEGWWWRLAFAGAALLALGVRTLITGAPPAHIPFLAINPDRAEKETRRLLIVLGVLGIVVALTAVVVLRPASSPVADAPRSTPTPGTAASPAAQARASSSTAAWYPKGYHRLSAEVAFRALPVSGHVCKAGSSCRSVDVVALHGCTRLGLLVDFFTSASTEADDSTLVWKAKVPAQHPVRIVITTPGAVARFGFSAAYCIRS